MSLKDLHSPLQNLLETSMLETSFRKMYKNTFFLFFKVDEVCNISNKYKTPSDILKH